MVSRQPLSFFLPVFRRTGRAERKTPKTARPATCLGGEALQRIVGRRGCAPHGNSLAKQRPVETTRFASAQRRGSRAA